MNEPTSPVIAVVTTMYRGDSVTFFEEAFASLEAQTHPQAKTHIYVCVDGPVPDTHEALLDQYSSRIHKVVRNPENKGIATALNMGFDTLEDETYVLRMDMDDLCDPERFAKQVAFMESHRDVDLCGCNSIEINEAGEEVYRRLYPETNAEIRGVLHRCLPILHPTYCIRGESLRKSGLRYRNRYLVEDLDFVLQAEKVGWTFHNLQEFLFRWRVADSFFDRRYSLKRAVAEFRVYSEGVWQMHGIGPKLAYPPMRFLFRLVPPKLSQRLYRSPLRNKALGGRVK